MPVSNKRFQSVKNALLDETKNHMNTIAAHTRERRDLLKKAEEITRLRDDDNRRNDAKVHDLERQVADLQREKKWKVVILHNGRTVAFDLDTQDEAEASATALRAAIRKQPAGRVEFSHRNNAHYFDASDIAAVTVKYGPAAVSS